MPKYRITSPDGRTIEINAPDGATQDQALEYAKSQWLKGPSAEPKAEGPATSPSKLKGSDLGGVFMGLRDAVDGGAQLLRRAVPSGVGQAVDDFGNSLADMGLPVARSSGVGGVDALVKAANSEYDDSRKMVGRDGVDLSRVAGNIINPVNRLVPIGGATSSVGVALRSGVQGLLSGLLQPVTDTNDYTSTKTGQTALGGLLGTGSGYALDKAAGAAASKFATMRERPGFPQWLGGKPQAPVMARADQQLANAAAQQGVDLSAIPVGLRDQAKSTVVQALNAGKRVDARAAVRLAESKAVLGDDAGFMTGQATRDPQLFARELDVRGIQGAGKPVADRLALQNQRLIDSLAKKGARGAPDNYDAGKAAISSLQELDARMSAGITDAYNKFRGASGSSIDVPMQPLAQRLGEVLDSHGVENIPPAVLKRMQSYGLTGEKQTKVFDLLEADKLIKSINANYDPMKGPQASALGILRKGLSESIDLAESQTKGATGQSAELLRDALGQAKSRFALHESIPALEAAAKDRGAQEAFVNQYFTSKSASIDTVERLTKILSPEARDSVQRNVLAGILEKAAPGAVRGSDSAKFSQAGLRNALDSIGDRKLEILFGKEGLAQLRQIGRVAEWAQAQPAGSAVNNSNTGSAVANLMQGLAGKSGSPMMNKLTGLPGVNIIKNSLSQSLDESAARTAMAAKIPTAGAKVSPEEINALRRFMPGLGGLLGSTAAGGLR